MELERVPAFDVWRIAWTWVQRFRPVASNVGAAARIRYGSRKWSRSDFLKEFFAALNYSGLIFSVFLARV